MAVVRLTRLQPGSLMILAPLAAIFGNNSEKALVDTVDTVE